MTKRMLIMLGGVLVLVLILAGGFALHIRSLIASAPKPTAQTVTAVTVAKNSWQPALKSVGSLSALRGVDISSEVVGQVRSVLFKNGQDVKQGDVLVQLNADSDIALLNSLEASAELAAITLKRDQAQLEIQAVSQSQVDNDMADLKSKKAQVAQQAALVAKKTIRAPFSGRLGISTVNPGLYLNAGDKIVTLQQIEPIRVDFNLPQTELAALRLGQKLELQVEGSDNKLTLGKLTAISPKLDTNTRNVQVQGEIANASRKLLPGMYANVNVEVGQQEAYLTLPQTAITYNAYGSTVFVIKDAPKDASGATPISDKVAQQVFVTTGATRGDQVAILSGLKEGDVVVTSGQLKLKSGTPVVVDNTVQPANDVNPAPQEH